MDGGRALLLLLLLLLFLFLLLFLIAFSAGVYAQHGRWVDVEQYKFEDFPTKVVVTVDGVRGAGDLPQGEYLFGAMVGWVGDPMV